MRHLTIASLLVASSVLSFSSYAGLFDSCATVIAIPGNSDGLKDSGCKVCANGAQLYYPCDNAGLCYCQGGTIPTQYVLPFTYCDNVVAVPNNANGVTDSQCSVCNNAGTRYYPCDQPNVLCRCGSGTTAAVGTTTQMQPTGGQQSQTGNNDATTTSTTPATVPAPTTAGSGRFASCANVIAIPGNADGVTDAKCSVCNSGAQTYYPCDTDAMCYCQGGTIPAQYVLPFTYCDNVVAVPNNANGVTDSQCSACSNAAYRYYPCDQPNVLCRCSSGPTQAAATTTTAPGSQPPLTSGNTGVSTQQPPTSSTVPAPTTAGSGRFASCANVIAIPGNADGVTDAKCSVCNNGAQLYYPCDTDAMCYCQGGTIPAQYVLPFTYCDNVVAVPNNANGVTDSQCSVCNNAGSRYYPCDQPNVLCRCGSGTQIAPSVSASNGPITTQAVPPTQSPSSVPTNNGPTSSSTTIKSTTAPAPITTRASGPFASCKAVAIPGNADGVTDAGCGACSYGAQTYYPCDNAALCYCQGSTIPPQYLLPFTYCDNVVAVPNSGLSNSQCSVCNNGANRYYPCDQPNVLCRCGNTPYVEPTTLRTTLATPAPTSSGQTLPAPTTRTTSTAPAPTGRFASCANVIAIPGNADGVTDAGCSVCALGGRSYYPCDTDAMCYCQGGTIPPQYVLPFTPCAAVSVPFNKNGVTDEQCAQCSYGAYRYYPCETRGEYCRCQGDPTSPAPTTTSTRATTQPPNVVSTAAPTAAPTSPPSTTPAGDLDGSEFLGNTIQEFKLRKPPSCPSRISPDLAACGGYDYEQVVCMSMYFYTAQIGGKSSIDWRGDCFTEDGFSDTSNENMNNRNLTLGWFDAGDYVKFNFPMSYSAMSLAWGALEFPSGYRSGVQLRSLLYNLRAYAFYILEGWDPVNQRLIAQVGSGGPDHSIWASCKNRRSEARKVWYLSPSCPGSDLAGDTASALAAIALVLKAEEGAASTALQNRLATAAKQIYDFANTYRGSYTTCVSDASAFYASFSGFNDELALAATWMASLSAAGLISSSTNYIQTAKNLYSYPWFISWDNKWLAVSLRLAQLTNEARYKSDVKVHVDETIASGTTTGGLWNVQQWGNLRYNANEAFSIRLANKLGILPDTYNVHAKRVIDYMLGSNPSGRSYVVGFGVNPPVRAHHRSAHDGTTTTNPVDNRHIIYGALVGGPYGNDVYYDDRDNYQMTEVATDYNALFTGALASFVGQNCRMNYGQTSYTTTPPAPTSPPQNGGSQYSLAPIKIEEWWLQLTISPTPYAATAIISNSATGASNTWTLEGPRWGQHWTASPTVAITNSDRIAILISPTSSATRLQYILREGALGISAVLSDNVESFAEEVFVATVASALEIDQSRVQVNAVQAGSVSVDFSIVTMPSTLYTAAGRKQCLAGSAGNCQLSPNTALESMLADNTSSLSVSLAAAIGSTDPVVVVRSATAGAATPDDNNGDGPGANAANAPKSEGGMSSSTIITIAVIAGGVVLLAAVVIGGAILYTHKSKAMRSVRNSDKYENEVEIKEKLNPDVVTRQTEV